MAIGNEGDILVADGRNHRIQRFISEGQYSASVHVGTRGSGHLQFFLPQGHYDPQPSLVLTIQSYELMLPKCVSLL